MLIPEICFKEGQGQTIAITQVRGDDDLHCGNRRGSGEQRQPKFGHILKLRLMGFAADGTWNMRRREESRIIARVLA